jgi:hypothetical protein
VNTVAIYLGANRSLTTISSAMMALHPEVTVLNHAFIRIFADNSLDFTLDPTQDKLDAFVRAAEMMALGGERGAVGGHILHSHAFGDGALRDAYLGRYGEGAKPGTRCLVWKDATRVTNHLIRHKIALGELARRLPSLRFIMMVRNPVDIAISSIRKGYAAALVGEERKDSFIDVFTHMIRLFGWFAPSVQANPAQFRLLFQDELLAPETLGGLCAFLGISDTTAWRDDIGRLIRLRESYPIDVARKASLQALVMRLIPDPFVARRVAEQIA